MTRSELIEALSQKTNQPRSVSERAVMVFFDAIQQQLEQGGRVELRGFGSFHVKQYPAYRGRNPRTGAPVVVAAKKLPVFRTGKEIREALINQKEKEV
jgi:integration host factor subunit beta